MTPVALILRTLIEGGIKWEAHFLLLLPVASF